MKKFFKKWLYRETRTTVVLTIFSGIFLGLSLFSISSYLKFDYSWGAIILSGSPILYNSIRKLLYSGNIRADLLISLALLACIYAGEYFAAGEVVFIMMIGELLEDYTVRISRAGLEKLLKMQPPTARVYRNNSPVIITADQVRTGDKIRINAGETISADGVIISGQTTVDESVMTGESIPVEKTAGDRVFCATTNHTGSIMIQATADGDNSSLTKMIRLIKNAENKKAPIIGTMDRLASRLVILAVILSVFTGLVTGEIIRGITVLVVFCPCALVLATPTAIAAGIGNATRHGVIIKSGAALEQLADIDRIAFDKTGTLTIGRPEIKEIYHDNCSGFNKDQLLKLAASAQQHSEHPIGKAIINKAREKELTLSEPDSIRIIPGKGIEAIVGGHKIQIGNLPLMKDCKVNILDFVMNLHEKIQNYGDTIIIIAINNHAAGIITLADKLRNSARHIIRRINNFNKATTILTGDNKVIAGRISAEAGITDFQAELLPEEKVSAIEKFNAAGEKVCMVGDGINDAPALKSAYIGIALADIGSDIAAESADIILVKDDLSKLPYILSLAARVKKKIRQNIRIALIMNFTAIALAGAGILTPVSGALAHNISSILVVLNAAMLLKNNSQEIKYS